MDGTDPNELLELAIEAACVAGTLLADRFRAGGEHGVSAKSTPTDLVSDADLASQRTIRELISSRRPDDGFLAEEEGGDVAGSSGMQWVVDPLDGTINFLFGIPLWCVSVAVQDAQGTLAGVVHDPLAGETFSALRGGLPQRNGLAIRPARRRASSLAQALVATGFAYDAPVRVAQADVVVGLIGEVRDIRRCGAAALDLAWTAAGRFDAFFERTVKVWDTAAGALLCECAGLEVHVLTEHPGLPAGILAAPPALVAPLRALVG
ncbi:MAG TPA: inositol monophosphatase family protein [Solirubrobacteraceae bacterium]|nr:inositol monophosphatase family protein [Solirubrobacteraceae bacterium]